MPIDSLLDKDNGARRAGLIDTLHAIAGESARGEERARQTTHYCVADRFGNVVSTTYTLNDNYGCKTLVAGGGFFLNNEMDDFSVKQDVPNMFGLVGGEANAIAPENAC